MEFSLHRQLKQRYAVNDARQEVTVGTFRIDVVVGDCLVEIQHGSLAAIRDKITVLLRRHRVLVVKPIIARKKLIKRTRSGGSIQAQRWSPKRGTPLDLFDELVHFTRVFPHPNLCLEVPLVQIEEDRVPGHGRRRRWRANDHEVQDQRLLDVETTLHFNRAGDLWSLLPKNLPTPFNTAHLAERLNVPRWTAQRIAFCMRETGAAVQVGKLGNTRLYVDAKVA